jgi:uncharacterized protein YlxW (UPF0749 family)
MPDPDATSPDEPDADPGPVEPEQEPAEPSDAGTVDAESSPVEPEQEPAEPSDAGTVDAEAPDDTDRPEGPDDTEAPDEPDDADDPDRPDQAAVSEEPEEPEEPTSDPDGPVAAPAATPQGRITRAFRSPGRSQVVVAVLLGVLGFAAVTQVRVNETDDNYSGLRQQELIDVLDALAGARQRAQAEIERLEDTREDLRNDSQQRRAALEQAQSDVDELSILAGLVPVTGPGIRLTVTEETGTVQLDSLLDVIQELRTADAEAIQINGAVRVVAETAIEEAEGGFVIDGEFVEAPYLIEAIGEPAALAGALDTRVGAGAGLVDDGAVPTVEKLNSLDITAVRDPEDPEYAVPDGDQ